jgi:hypothetical protein
MSTIVRRIARLCRAVLMPVVLVFTLASWSHAGDSFFTQGGGAGLQQYGEDSYGTPKCGGSCNTADCCKIVRVEPS